MSTALTGPEPASQPDPDRPADRAPTLQRFAGLLRRVIDYGKQLIIAVRLRAACPEFPRLARPFGTTDLKRILARISVAISRAVLLEGGFLRQARLGLYAVAPRIRTPSARKPRADRPETAPHRDPAPARRTGNPLVPTAAKLAAELRRHPIGVVLAGICRDLGITPHHPLWEELCHAVVACGGSIAELAQDEDTQWCSKQWLEIPVARPASIPACLWPKWWPQPAPLAATATGPPGVG